MFLTTPKEGKLFFNLYDTRFQSGHILSGHIDDLREPIHNFTNGYDFVFLLNDPRGFFVLGVDTHTYFLLARHRGQIPHSLMIQLANVFRVFHSYTITNIYNSFIDLYPYTVYKQVFFEYYYFYYYFIQF